MANNARSSSVREPKGHLWMVSFGNTVDRNICRDYRNGM